MLIYVNQKKRQSVTRLSASQTASMIVFNPNVIAVGEGLEPPRGS